MRGAVGLLDGISRRGGELWQSLIGFNARRRLFWWGQNNNGARSIGGRKKKHDNKIYAQKKSAVHYDRESTPVQNDTA